MISQLASCKRIFAGLVFIAGVGCFADGVDAAEPRRVTVYVVSHGWHTGIVVPRRAIPATLLVGVNFSGETFLEFGWGDAGFYRAESPAFWESMKAALLPTAAVLHVVGFRMPVAEFFPVSGIVSVDLSPEAFNDLARFVDATLVKQGAGPMPPLGSGLYGHSRFYAAHGTYTVFNNCNHWVARGLRRARLPIDPDDAMTATAVFDQVRRVGTTLRGEP